MPLLTISIASWNTKNLTKQTLESILANTKFKDFEIVAVDNASTDGSVDMIKEYFPQVKLIQNSENIGFGTERPQEVYLRGYRTITRSVKNQL